jgi:hypothetical protein
VPDHASREAKASGSVVRKLIHHGARGQRRRDRHAVAHVAQSRPGDRHVDGDEQRVVAGLGGAIDQRHRTVAVLPHVELEPVPPTGVGRGDVLDRGGAHRRQRERDAGSGRRRGPGDLALGLHHPGEPRRGDAERQRDLRAEHLARGVDGRDVAQDRGVELDVGERFAGPGEPDLAVGGTVGVVERGLRRTPLGHRAQVVDGQGLVEPTLLGRQLGLLEPHQRGQVVRLGQLPLHGPSLPGARSDRETAGRDAASGARGAAAVPAAAPGSGRRPGPAAARPGAPRGRRSTRPTSAPPGGRRGCPR